MKKIISWCLTFCVGLGMLGALVQPVHAITADTDAGTLIKGSMSSIYYYASDGNRYSFPNERIYFSWYDDFDSIETISDSELASIPLEANVTYRPGTRMVKLTSVPSVYAVDQGGVLRWVASEEVARSLYGTDWNTHIDDLPDVFYTNYTVGEDITDPDDFNRSEIIGWNETIGIDLGLDDNTDYEECMNWTPSEGPPAPEIYDMGASVESGTDFTIRWSDTDCTAHFVLYRDVDPSFSDSVIVASGPDTTDHVENLEVTSTMIFYYYAESHNVYDVSDPSEIVYIEVTLE